MATTTEPTKLTYKGITEHAFRSDDIHTLMDMVDKEIRLTPILPDSAGYIDYLNGIKDRLMALWLEIRPGQSAICTIREDGE